MWPGTGGLEHGLQHNGGDDWDDKHEGGQHWPSTGVAGSTRVADLTRVAEVCLAAGMSFCTMSVR